MYVEFMGYLVYDVRRNQVVCMEKNMNQILYNELLKIMSEEQVKTEEPMKNHTTFRVGGPAEFFVMPRSAEEVKKVIDLCRRESFPYYIIGNGSNLLVSDQGYRGVVLQIYKEMSYIEIEENVVVAQAGALLSAIANKALENGLTGFEFAAGIPGTLGGACVMNAGAYGGEMKDVLEEVTVLTEEGEVLIIPKENLELGYRTSIIARKGYIVLEARIQLREGEKEAIKSLMEELKDKRVSKQPLEYPSAGSTFKRPEGYFAGKLIQDAGLKGYQVGDAQVSEKHSGFVINRGNATASDVMQLISDVKDKVKEQFGVTMEPEVKRVGRF